MPDLSKSSVTPESPENRPVSGPDKKPDRTRTPSATNAPEGSSLVADGGTGRRGSRPVTCVWAERGPVVRDPYGMEGFHVWNCCRENRSYVMLKGTAVGQSQTPAFCPGCGVAP